ncbi:venom nerve growth factor 2-like [Centruroides sculpturatus]|uniref:venom nerve growth factor 2-like n=1 Tax=Centruroides sculpturatus TaxID=218467 RepID=UPI000C6DBA9F|nr:venom nerve growth factor 2-like [Centruroides sculpturatus]
MAMLVNISFEKSVEKQDVCPTEARWVIKNYARNIYGKPVKVLQRYSLNRTLVYQYFYEKHCRNWFGEGTEMDYGREGKCKGINNQIWVSRCRQQYSWIYARVINSGVIGWDFIAIKSSCSCTISFPDNNIKNKEKY